MYVNYAESNHWKVELISVNENGIGGFKEVVAMVTGKGAYSKPVSYTHLDVYKRQGCGHQVMMARTLVEKNTRGIRKPS